MNTGAAQTLRNTNDGADVRKRQETFESTRKTAMAASSPAEPKSEAGTFSHGGARKGAGRKPSGRVQYVTRLRPDLIARIKKLARAHGFAECDIIENALALFIGKAQDE